MQYRDFSSYIACHPGVSQEDLAAHLGVSTRTVRKYVRQFNSGMSDCSVIELVPGAGYRLRVFDDVAFDQRVRRLDDLVESGLPSTPEQRVSYILNDLLMRPGWAKLDDFAQALYVSRRTISYDMRKVEDRLTAFGLALEEKPYRGVRVMGSEADKRSCWTSEMGAILAGGGSLLVGDLVGEVAQLIENEVMRLGVTLDSMVRQSLVLHIVIAIMRIKVGAYVPMEPVDLTDIAQRDTYPLAEALAQRVGEHCGIELPEEEVAYIALHLGDASPFAADGSQDNVSDTPVMHEAWLMAGRMVEGVYHVFGFDFRDDAELRFNLARHIEPLMSRLGHETQMENPLLIDIKRCYPLAYAMAVDSSAELLKTCQVAPSDDEVGYIALAFALAIERMKSHSSNKKRVLIVCPSDAGSSRLLEYLFTKEFGALLDRVETCSVAELEDHDFSRIDYVFTTVPIAVSLPVPVMHISALLTGDDMGRVHRALTNRLAGEGVPRFFRPRLFVPHVTALTRDDAITQLCDVMNASYGYELPDNFCELVLQRENAFSTAFGNRVAMPHPAEAACLSTFACIGLLDEPVVWDSRGNEVQMVVLMAFASDSADEVSALMRILAGFLADTEMVDQLLTERTWSTLTSCIERAMSNEGGETHGVEWTV